MLPFYYLTDCPPTYLEKYLRAAEGVHGRAQAGRNEARGPVRAAVVSAHQQVQLQLSFHHCWLGTGCCSL